MLQPYISIAIRIAVQRMRAEGKENKRQWKIGKLIKLFWAQSNFHNAKQSVVSSFVYSSIHRIRIGRREIHSPQRPHPRPLWTTYRKWKFLCTLGFLLWEKLSLKFVGFVCFSCIRLLPFLSPPYPHTDTSMANVRKEKNGGKLSMNVYWLFTLLTQILSSQMMMGCIDKQRWRWCCFDCVGWWWWWWWSKNVNDRVPNVCVYNIIKEMFRMSAAGRMGVMSVSLSYITLYSISGQHDGWAAGRERQNGI